MLPPLNAFPISGDLVQVLISENSANRSEDMSYPIEITLLDGNTKEEFGRISSIDPPF